MRTEEFREFAWHEKPYFCSRQCLLVTGANLRGEDVSRMLHACLSSLAGKLNCTVECNPLLGPAAFDAIEAVKAGRTVPKKTIVKDEVFEQSVAKDVIGRRKY